MDADQQRAALTWAASKMRDCGERAKSAAAEAGLSMSSSSLPAAAADVAAALERVAALADKDAKVAALAPEPLSQRFGAALALREPSAAAAGGGAAKTVGGSIGPAQPLAPQLVSDPVTAAFWR